MSIAQTVQKNKQKKTLSMSNSGKHHKNVVQYAYKAHIQCVTHL